MTSTSTTSRFESVIRKRAEDAMAESAPTLCLQPTLVLMLLDMLADARGAEGDE